MPVILGNRYPLLLGILHPMLTMERLIREVRRGTKVRDYKFSKEEAVYKLLYLEPERQEERWAAAKA